MIELLLFLTDFLLLSFLQNVPSGDEQAFLNARAIWTDKITGDLSDIDMSGLSSGCSGYPNVVDDMYICGEMVSIDGSGGILGSAGPE